MLVVTDSAFSMDGDVADIRGLIDVCAGHGALAAQPTRPTWCSGPTSMCRALRPTTG